MLQEDLYTRFYTNDPNTLVISVLGAMGNGKSSLLNSIAGERIYPTGVGVQPVTTQVDGVTRPWAYPRLPRHAHLIDTPGMCDASMQDRRNINEMIRYFKTLSYGVSAFLLVFNVHDTRLDMYTQNMLHLFEGLLGKEFWKYVVIVFTFCDDGAQDELASSVNVLKDPNEGFVANLQRIFNLDPQVYNPPVIFVTNKDVRFSSYAHQCLRYLYDAIVSREQQQAGRRFGCSWFQQIRYFQRDDQQSNFILDSIRNVMQSMRSKFRRPDRLRGQANGSISICPTM